MIKKNINDVPKEIVEIDGAEGVQVQWIFGEKDNVPTFHFRIFHVQAGGKTPKHKHPWEHEVLILKGKGKVYFEGEYIDFSEGDAFYIPPNKEHCFLPETEGKFICLIPKEGK